MRRATPKCPGLCLGQGHPWAPGENKVCVPHLPPCLSVTRRRCPQCGKAAGQKASAYPPVMWVHRQGDTKSPTTGRRVCHPGAVCGPSVLSVPAKCFPLPRGSFEQPGAWGPRDPGHAERGRALEPLPRDQRHPCRRFKVLIPKWGSHCPARVRGLMSEQDTLGMERKRGAMETAGVPHIPLERAGPAPLPVGPRCNKVLRSQSRSMFGFLVFPPGAAALRLTTRDVVPTVLNGARGREGTPGIILGVPCL